MIHVQGTGLAVLTTIGLSLPCIIPDLLKDPNIYPLSYYKFMAKHLMFRFSVSPESPHPTIESPWYSVVTSMFNHGNVSHFISNMFTISTSAFFLDLGFFKTMFLLVGGAVCGCAALVAEMAYLRNPYYEFLHPKHTDSIEKVADDLFTTIKKTIWESEVLDTLKDKIVGTSKKLKTTSRNFIGIGSSAGGFALIGAETVILFKEFRSGYNSLAEKCASIEERQIKRQRTLDRMARVASQITLRVVTIASQLASVYNQSDNPFDRFSLIALEPGIGFSCHIGGFIFGAICGFFW